MWRVALTIARFTSYATIMCMYGCEYITCVCMDVSTSHVYVWV